MPMFTVRVSRTTQLVGSFNVEASSAEAARAIASEMLTSGAEPDQGGLPQEYYDGEVERDLGEEVTDVEEVKEGA